MDGSALLRSYLKRTGQMQKEVAAAAGLLEDQVSRFLSGDRNPSLSSALAIAKATGGAVPVEAWRRRSRRRKAS